MTRYYNLADYGVVCDGKSDNAQRINSLISEIRKEYPNPNDRRVRIVFPSGTCVVEKTVDLTSLRGKGTAIVGGGTRIIGRTSGTPVIDALGSEYIRFEGLNITGDRSRMPNVGLLIGRSDETSINSADNIDLEGMTIDGSFSLAALYNLNAETSSFNHLILVNEADIKDSYTLVLDGINHFGVQSAFTSSRQKTDFPQSFNENLFMSCDIRHNGAGVPVWIAHTSRLEFLRSYIASLHSKVGIIIFSNGSEDVSTLLKLDVHLETKALETAIKFSGPNRSIIFRGLSLIDQYPGAQRFVFGAEPGVSVRIENVELNLPNLPPSTKIFDPEPRWMVSGFVYVGKRDAWNLKSESFSGVVNLAGNIQFKSGP